MNAATTPGRPGAADTAPDALRTVAAVVTAFRAGENLVELVETLAPVLGAVVVVDDGSGTGSDAVLARAQAAGATVVRHPQNRGIAAALNTGIAAARAAGGSAPVGTTPPAPAAPAPAPAFVLTLDQDSRIDAALIQRLVATARDAASAGLPVGLVAPARIEGLPSAAVSSEKGFLIGGTPIQSGMLIPVDTVDAVGPFAEALFIDGVDTDFALRVTASGRRVLLAMGTELGHSLGERHTPRLLGRPVALGGAPVALVVSKPFRYYYLVRNRILLNRRYGRSHRAWTVQQTLADLRHCVIVQLLLPGRRARGRAMLAGLRAGWAGRAGRIPSPVEAQLR
ncbi:glycosyltransferase [Herbiconiux sp.]|uniref:glycosyltransferase n=1 Tax=Herbiconiux sp. TaxID=1871186 RepID=UPI0025BFE79A|nr:glycosyltransferase [Herbiconiux sp.]